MKVSIKEISQATGFSPATVSNALNRKKGVNENTAATILRVANELGYFSEPRISRLKYVMFKKTGSIVEDTPFFTQQIIGVEQECKESGMDMIMCNLDSRESNFREAAEQIMNDQSSMVILLGTELTEEDLWIIRGMKCPFVVVDYWNEDMTFNGVLINNADSARMAVEYLIEKGHSEIGYLRGSFRIKPFRSREYGYENTLRRYSLPKNPDYQVTLSATMDGAYQDMKAHLAKNPPLPTAFFADNDIIALGAMKALWECNIRIPDDVSVIGFDDLSYSSISMPPLTTVRVPKQAIGREAVRRLKHMVQDGDNFKLKIQVCTDFIERSSVRDLNENPK